MEDTMREIIVIQCAKSKNPPKETWQFGGKKVTFIANPSICEESATILYCKPDSKIPDSNITWRQKLEEYNRVGGNPPEFLRKAWQLYKSWIYAQLIDRYGEKDIFILSAGWGLIRSDYLLPHYDITFARGAKACNRRKENDIYDDFNHLKDEKPEETDTVYFFGTSDYLSLYCYLTQGIPSNKVIFYVGENEPDEAAKSSYTLKQYREKPFTNWQYSCAKDFVEGKLRK
jgi:hypothetical protein